MITIYHGNEKEWLATRRRGLAASEVPILFGSGYRGSNVFSLWLSKVRGIEPWISPQMRRTFEFGHHMEALLHRWTEEELGVELEDPGDFTVFLRKGGVFPLSCTVDRTIPAKGNALVEFKEIYAAQAREYGRSKRFRAAVIQLTVGMMVADATEGYVGAFFPPADFRLIPVVRAPALEAQIEERGAEFWGFVEREEVPGPEFIDDTEEIGRALAEIYAEQAPDVVELPPSWGPALDRLQTIRELESELKIEKDTLKHLAMRAIGHASEGIVPGHPRKFKFNMESREETVMAAWKRRVLRDVKA